MRNYLMPDAYHDSTLVESIIDVIIINNIKPVAMTG